MNTSMTNTRSQNGNQNQDQNQTGREQAMSERASQTPITPRFDIWEGEDAFILYGDFPGVTPEDLDIQFENQVLTVQGRVTSRSGMENVLHAEYGPSDFYRSFTLGESINSEAISAELRDGVLTLRLPKSDRAKPRRIPLNAT